MLDRDFLRRLGLQVRARRKLRGLSQEQLSAMSGISTRYIASIEAGQGNVSILRFLDLIDALGVPLRDALLLDKWHPIVALIGLRGSGKSTVGPELAQRLDRPFVELDALIEEEAGLRLPEIFAIQGESYYRRVEREVLTRFVLGGLPAVLATGGSLVTDRATFDLLKEQTTTIWLRARPDLHLQRVSAQGDRRPMAGRADPLADLKSLLDEREALYSEADITIDTTALSPEEVAKEAVRLLGAKETLR
jgi:XRE family aerobic/anaerobic benzoate catabolism transcriptional regulator